jgi:hypothetical protein
MVPWEIWTYDFPVEGPHPCVIFNNAFRLPHPDLDRINVLLCRTLRGTAHRDLKPTEILLDRADGLDWATISRIDLLHSVSKTGLHERRGIVCMERRRLISQRIYSLFPFQTSQPRRREEIAAGVPGASAI